MKFYLQKLTFLATFILIFNQCANGIVIKATTFRHPKSSQLITLIGDMHFDAIDKVLTKTEQEIILKQAKKYNAAVVAEDTSSSTVDHYKRRFGFIYKSNGIDMNGPLVKFKRGNKTPVKATIASALLDLTKKCEENNITTTNLEHEMHTLMRSDFLEPYKYLPNSRVCPDVYKYIQDNAVNLADYGEENEDAFGIIPYCDISLNLSCAMAYFASLQCASDIKKYQDFLHRYTHWYMSHKKTVPSPQDQILFKNWESIRDNMFVGNMMRSIYTFRHKPHVIIFTGNDHINDFLPQLNKARFVKLFDVEGSYEALPKEEFHLADSVDLETYFKQLDEILAKQNAQAIALTAASTGAAAAAAAGSATSAQSSSAGASSSSSSSSSSSQIRSPSKVDSKKD